MRWLVQYKKYLDKYLHDESREKQIYVYVTCYNGKVYTCNFHDFYASEDLKLVCFTDRNIKLNFDEIVNVSFDEDI